MEQGGNESEESTQGVVPLYGLDGHGFNAIHITAIVSLTISIVTSINVLLYQCCTSHVPFFRRPIGDRLVVYLALVDLSFSVWHEVDHIFIYVLKDYPPDLICKICAFFLQEFMLGQAVVVTFIAFSACVMVVRERGLSLGRYDWRLIASALGIPFVLVFTQGIFGYLGPSGPWCIVNMGKRYGPLVSNIISIAIITTFCVNIICYLMVWIKIKRVTRVLSTMDASRAANCRSHHRSARIMMLFVVAYIVQWWAYTTHAVWTFYGVPPINITVSVVFFTNFGGVFNFVAYTLVRRIWQTRDPSTCRTRGTFSGSKCSISGATTRHEHEHYSKV